MALPTFERVTDGPLDCLVSVPPRMQEAPAVLCFLHGYDEAAPMPLAKALTLRGPLTPEAAPVARERFLVVAPQLPRAGDVWHRFANDVLTVVESAVRRFGGDPAHPAHAMDARRRFLTGFSFGGNGVFDLAAAQPGHWHALWAVDPTRVPPTRLGDTPLWLSIGAAARWSTAAFVRALHLEPAPRRAAAADGAPATRRIYRDEGLDHVGSATSAYGDAGIYAWLLAHADGARGAR